MNYAPPKAKQTQAQLAQRHYAALLTHGVHARERAELAAADVPVGSIEALYGSPAKGVLAGLSRRYAEVGCPPTTRWAEDAIRAIRQIELSLSGADMLELTRDLEEAMTSASFASLLSVLKELVPPLRETTFGKRSTPKKPWMDATLALWYAQWFMRRRENLIRRNRNRADQLMVWVAKNLLPAGA